MARARVQVLPRSKAAVCLDRGDNLVRTVELADRESNPDGVGTSAVQASIALGDAYTIYFRNERCRGQDHHEVLALIARCQAPNDGEIGRTLSRILDRKGEVEYADRAVSLKEARELERWVGRLSALVHAEVEPPRGMLR
ncbi:MAG TPA: hypothetical protein VMH38_03830 [Thermoplasmata archaeon]|nr:hypothetical protein [Thermoplasmata archaeon]